MISLMKVKSSESIRSGLFLAWFYPDGSGIELLGIFRPKIGGLMLTFMRPSLTLYCGATDRGWSE
jgi:hypothetical protein